LLGFVVERFELVIGEEIVYRSEEGVAEGLAFRLYSDGIRELRFLPGASLQDLRSFVDALGGLDAETDADDDVVTRLWAKDLATISFVTAEDIMQAPSSTSELLPQS